MTDSSIYSDENAQADANSVTLLRILDVQYAILTHLDEKMAARVIDKHAEGGLIGPVPQFDPEELL